MAISSTTNKVIFTSENVSAEYPFTDFTVYSSSDLSVYSITSAGVESLLTETTDYTVALDGTAPNTGTVTLIAAYPTSGKIVVKRKPSPVQSIAFADGIATPASIQNKGLDYLTMICQSLQEEVDRCVKSTSDTSEPGDAVDWTTIIGTGSITAAMLNADVTTLINGLITAGTLDTSDVNALIAAGITGKANIGANSDITSLTGCSAISPSSGDITLSPTAGHIVSRTASGAEIVTYNTGAVGITLKNGGSYAIEVTHDVNTGNFFVFHDTDSVVGTISFAGNTTAYNTTSDERLKSNVEDFTALDLVRLMKPKKYDRAKGTQKEYGFLAQKLYEVLPEAVTVGGTNVKKNPWMVDLTKLIPVSIQAIIELDKENDRLRKRIKAVEDKVGI